VGGGEVTERLATRSWGAGPPVVFLHGLGASSRYWTPLQRTLAASCRGIVPDLLGFGRSPKPADSRYGVEEHLAALEPVVPDQATLVAHSTGGLLAAALAARSPRKVKKLVLIGCPAYPDATTAIAEIGGLGALAKWSVQGSRLAELACWLMCELRPVLLPIAPLLARDVPREVASDFMRHTWTSYVRTLRNVVVEHRLLPDLLQAGIPTTFVHGSDDATARLRHVESAVEELRRYGRPCDLRVIAGGDHHVALRFPTAVASAIRLSGAS
jgi:pimeloyl-ACP methyl ester carboxylesterase